MIKTAAGGVLALVISASTLAQTQPPEPPPTDDPEATYVPELVVQGRLPGPAWWRVSDGDTVVYVLGLPNALAKGQVWDQGVLKRRLDGANVLITPPTIEAGVNPLAVPGLLISARRTLGDAPAGEGLTPEQTARLEQAAAAAGLSADRYAGQRPWVAGVRFAADHRKRVGLDASEPLNAIRRAAKAAKVKAVPATVRKMKVKSIIAEVRTVPAAEGRACFDSAIAEVQGADATRRIAAAWAVGDVRTALGASRTSESCITALPGVADEVREIHRRQADAIENALATPGHAVAALSLRSLLAEGGTLAQLRARGHEVRAPE